MANNNSNQTLIRAWMRLMYYDKITQDEKSNFTRLRRIIILLTLAITVLSVTILLFDIISRDQNWVFALMAGVSAFLMFLYLIPTTFLKFIPFIFKIFIPSLFYSVIKKDKRRWNSTRPNPKLGENFKALEDNTYITWIWFLRILLFILIVIASLSMFAVVYVLMDSNATDLQNALGIIILSLPIIGLNVLNYTELYAGPTTWIQYRVAAEKIRSNIYLYRTKTEKACIEDSTTQNPPESTTPKPIQSYSYTKESERDIKLASILSQVTDEIPQKVPYTRNNGQPENVDDEIGEEDAKKLIKPALEYSAEGDDGLGDLVDDEKFKIYIKTRVHKQIDWYRDRVEKDYLRSKRYTQYAMIITTLGSVLGIALSVIDPRLVGLVAIANAISVALTSWTNVTMIGKTYNIYNTTWQRLDNTLTEWRAVENRLTDKIEGRRIFIAEVECILMTELSEWSKTAMEIQVSNDRSMRNNLAKEDIKSSGWYKDLTKD